MLSGSSHLVGCRLSGCCRRSLREKCQSRTSSEKVCGFAWHRRNLIELFRTPTIGRTLASLASLHSGFQGSGSRLEGKHSESTSAANCLPCQKQAMRILQRTAISTRRILPWIVRPHDLKACNAHITCVLEDPHYGLEPSLCSQYSYTGIVPVRPLTGSSWGTIHPPTP